MAISMLYVTCADEKEAMALGELLLQERLIACVNVFPMSSAFWWQGTLDKAREWVAIMKTRPSLVTSVEQAIKAHHSYQTPCIIRWLVEANPEYEAWITKETSPDRAS